MYFAKSRLARTKSDPADARSLAEMAMRDTPPTRDPLAGVELRQAARFAMTLVTEQAKVCQRLIRLVELGFPELGELFDDPTCRTAREVLRVAPTARAAARRRTSTLANANAGPGHRRLGVAKAERLQAAAADSIAVPELEPEVAFEVGLLLDQYDLLERQIEDADRRALARGRRQIDGVADASQDRWRASVDGEHGHQQEQHSSDQQDPREVVGPARPSDRSAHVVQARSTGHRHRHRIAGNLTGAARVDVRVRPGQLEPPGQLGPPRRDRGSLAPVLQVPNGSRPRRASSRESRDAASEVPSHRLDSQSRNSARRGRGRTRGRPTRGFDASMTPKWPLRPHRDPIRAPTP